MSLRGWSPARWIGLLAGVYAVTWINVFWPVLRFTSPALNYSFFAMAQLIPWVIAILATRLKGWRGWALGIMAVVISILSAPFGLISAGCALETMHESMDPIFKRVRAVPTTRGAVVVYHADTGAVGADALVIRQQCALLPGLLVVRERLKSPEHAYRPQVEQVDSSRVRIVLGYWENRSRQVLDKTVGLALLPCLWSKSG